MIEFPWKAYLVLWHTLFVPTDWIVGMVCCDVTPEPCSRPNHLTGTYCRWWGSAFLTSLLLWLLPTPWILIRSDSCWHPLTACLWDACGPTALFQTTIICNPLINTPLFMTVYPPICLCPLWACSTNCTNTSLNPLLQKELVQPWYQIVQQQDQIHKLLPLNFFQQFSPNWSAIINSPIKSAPKCRWGTTALSSNTKVQSSGRAPTLTTNIISLLIGPAPINMIACWTANPHDPSYPT